MKLRLPILLVAAMACSVLPLQSVSAATPHAAIPQYINIQESVSELPIEELTEDDFGIIQSVQESVRVVREVSSDINNGQIFVTVEQQASFPGGMNALMQWLAANLIYPESAQQNCIEGRVIVKFIVNTDGAIEQPSVVKGVDKDLDKEAIRLVKRMPRWIPGKNNGVAVRSYFTLPITFKLISSDDKE